MADKTIQSKEYINKEYNVKVVTSLMLSTLTNTYYLIQETTNTSGETVTQIISLYSEVVSIIVDNFNEITYKTSDPLCNMMETFLKTHNKLER